ncbi:hypothetical protein SteCoe_30663 [Stentor coeruleus]|uniref:Uncharacterized protein n=1 Tax=Stentor coeruleus TaxID=5963 RepID=A0A1R2B376_9CILI|nr:hypothetical protein SteCoe_30663 [Stentor coeruleus]
MQIPLLSSELKVDSQEHINKNRNSRKSLIVQSSFDDKTAKQLSSLHERRLSVGNKEPSFKRLEIPSQPKKTESDSGRSTPNNQLSIREATPGKINYQLLQPMSIKTEKKKKKLGKTGKNNDPKRPNSVFKDSSKASMRENSKASIRENSDKNLKNNEENSKVKGKNIEKARKVEDGRKNTEIGKLVPEKDVQVKKNMNELTEVIEPEKRKRNSESNKDKEETKDKGLGKLIEKELKEIKKVANHEKVPEKNDKVPEKNDKIPEKHDKIPEKHDKIPEKHDKVPEKVEKHDKIPEKSEILKEEAKKIIEKNETKEILQEKQAWKEEERAKAPENPQIPVSREQNPEKPIKKVENPPEITLKVAHPILQIPKNPSEQEIQSKPSQVSPSSSPPKIESPDIPTVYISKPPEITPSIKSVIPDKPIIEISALPKLNPPLFQQRSFSPLPFEDVLKPSYSTQAIQIDMPEFNPLSLFQAPKLEKFVFPPNPSMKNSKSSFLQPELSQKEISQSARNSPCPPVSKNSLLSPTKVLDAMPKDPYSNTFLSLSFSYSERRIKSQADMYESEINEIEQNLISSFTEAQKRSYTLLKSVQKEYKISNSLNLSKDVQCTLILPEECHDKLEKIRRKEKYRDLLAKLFDHPAEITFLTPQVRRDLAMSLKGHKKSRCSDQCEHLKKALIIKHMAKGQPYPVKIIKM